MLLPPGSPPDPQSAARHTIRRLPAASAPRPEPPPPETIAVAADDDLMAVFGGLD